MISGKTFRSEFAKGVLTLVSGTAIAQVINFGASIFLARIYKPDDFGAVSLFTAIVSFILVVSCGKFDVAVVAAKTEEDAKRLFSLSFFINLFVSLLTLACAAIIIYFSLDVYKDTAVYEWLPLVSCSVLFLTGVQILWMWNVRKKNFGNISFVRIAEAVTMNGFAILFKAAGAFGLLMGTLLSQFASFLMLGWVVLKKDPLKSFETGKDELKSVFRTYSEFPKVNILQGFIDIFQMNAIVILATGQFEQAVIGFYGMCMRVLQVPMRLIVLPVSHVFFAKASEVHREGGDLFSLVKKTIGQTILFALPVPLVLAIAGPDLFSLVFGETWREAGVYARILSGWIFLDLVRAPIAQVASIVGKQKYVLYVSVFGNILLLGALWIGVFRLDDPRWTMGLVAMSQSLIALILIFLILNISRSKE
jgi:lipopolysaccharide exporter